MKRELAQPKQWEHVQALLASDELQIFMATYHISFTRCRLSMI